jgi:hypothetical protein
VGRRLVVHHRYERNAKSLLITLCNRCHVRLHRSRRLRYWVPEALLGLWRELHPSAPLQLQLPLAMTNYTSTKQSRLREAKESSQDLAAVSLADMNLRLFNRRSLARTPI